MRGTHPRSTPSTASALTAVLGTTIRAVEQAVRERAEADLPPRPDIVCAETWQLVHLLGALSELAAMTAPQVGGYPLHVDNHSGPDRLVAHACRELAALRHALDDGQRAAREIYTALSHFGTLPPTSHHGAESPGGPDREEGR